MAQEPPLRIIAKHRLMIPSTSRPGQLNHLGDVNSYLRQSVFYPSEIHIESAPRLQQYLDAHKDLRAVSKCYLGFSMSDPAKHKAMLDYYGFLQKESRAALVVNFDAQGTRALLVPTVQTALPHQFGFDVRFLELAPKQAVVAASSSSAGVRARRQRFATIFESAKEVAIRGDELADADDEDSGSIQSQLLSAIQSGRLWGERDEESERETESFETCFQCAEKSLPLPRLIHPTVTTSTSNTRVPSQSYALGVKRNRDAISGSTGSSTTSNTTSIAGPPKKVVRSVSINEEHNTVSLHPNTSTSTASKAQQAQDHYNKVERDRDSRHKSQIYHMRNLNNFIKSTLISDIANSVSQCTTRERVHGEGLRVLDLACGKGGDIHKWSKSKAGK